MAIRIRRRELIVTLASGAAIACPLSVRAQQGAKIARIGFLGATSQAASENQLKRFRAGLRHLGYVEGENLLIDFRWSEGNYARLAEFAAEFVRQQYRHIAALDVCDGMSAVGESGRRIRNASVGQPGETCLGIGNRRWIATGGRTAISPLEGWYDA